MDQEYEKRLCRTPSKSTASTRRVGSSATTSPLCSPVKTPLSAGKQSTPVSPAKERYGDRFIPSRAGARWHINFNNVQESASSVYAARRAGDSEAARDSLAYSCLLKNELLSAGINELRAHDGDDSRRILAPTQAQNMLHYRSRKSECDSSSPYCLSPVSMSSQSLLRSPRKTVRKISKTPFKVLDAPELQDDFYLNLVDWSVLNVVCVGLNHCVYLWSAHTSQVTRLCDLSADNDTVTSVAWNDRGSMVAVGTNKGMVQLWDVAQSRRLVQLPGHTARVGALAWGGGGDSLCSGSRDRAILQRDFRTPHVVGERKLTGHRQEVCGLKWSPDSQLLASGGNDNRLFVWSQHSTSPLQTYTDHVAAVKAIAWSPHQHGLLASGGGTADKCIRFWNTLTGQPLQCLDTGSQVCNLSWSRHTCELVSTHGYSQHQILVWKYPSLTQVAKLTGHTYRVLYLAMSPDGESIVTGAGDETLRFWNIFSKARTHKTAKSPLNLFTSIR